MGKMTTEQCLAYLQKKSSTNGDSVFAHLAQLIQTIVYKKPENAVDILETSFLLKQTRYIPDEGPKVPRSWKDHKDEKFVQQFISLQSIPDKKPPPPAVDPESDEPPPEEEPEEEEEPPEYTADNFLADSIFFEAIGAGLGRVENYHVVLIMRQLGATKVVSKMRFFGKFFGIKSNYFVFETTSEPPPEPEGGEEEEDEDGKKKTPWGRPAEIVPMEPGIGPNAYTYWVCSRPGAELYRLPDVTPLQIKTARQIKKFLTGDLKAEVSAYPPFPGVEENYLRAQIARIAATTEIAPKGFHKEPEEEEGEESGPLEPDEEYTPLSFEELQSLENWVHKNKYLNLQGRTKLFVPEKEEEEEEEEGEEKEEVPPSPEELEEIPPALTSIDTDKDLALPEGESWKPWSFITSSTHKHLKHQVLGLRSALWPGAYTIVTPTGFSTVYVGWGLKNQPFVAPLPPPVLKECELTPESLELPPIPKPPEENPEGEEGEGEEEE